MIGRVTSICLALLAPLAVQPLLAAPPPGSTVQSANHMALIRPFVVTGSDIPEWFGRSIAQSLETQARSSGFMAAKEPDLLVPSADPLGSLASRGIGLLVEGTCESDGHTLRVRGNIVDVATGQRLAGLAANGSPRDLMSIKDVLVGQFAAAFSASSAAARTTTPRPAPPALAPAPPAPGSEFEGSRLEDALANPEAYDRAYDALYREKVTRSRSWRYPLLVPGVYYPPGYYFPRVIYRQRDSVQVPVQTGISFDAHYRSNKWKIDISGGAGQTSSSGGAAWETR